MLLLLRLGPFFVLARRRLRAALATLRLRDSAPLSPITGRARTLRTLRIARSFVRSARSSPAVAAAAVAAVVFLLHLFHLINIYLSRSSFASALVAFAGRAYLALAISTAWPLGELAPAVSLSFATAPRQMSRRLRDSGAQRALLCARSFVSVSRE